MEGKAQSTSCSRGRERVPAWLSFLPERLAGHGENTLRPPVSLTEARL